MCTDVKERSPLVSVIMPAYNAEKTLEKTTVIKPIK